MALNFYEMRWPIEDEGLTRSELMEEAYGDILEELDKLSLLPISAPVYSWHQTRRGVWWLVARLAVTDCRIPAVTGAPA
jgi:uncharacterized protein YjiS (DUF1127 family)